jgi:hypothetical protein
VTTLRHRRQLRALKNRKPVPITWLAIAVPVVLYAGFVALLLRFF